MASAPCIWRRFGDHGRVVAGLVDDLRDTGGVSLSRNVRYSDVFWRHDAVGLRQPDAARA
jgi:hypothetical protein